MASFAKSGKSDCCSNKEKFNQTQTNFSKELSPKVKINKEDCETKSKK